MNLFDIVGPVMVGPSSSHTAGAVKIGRVAKKLFGKDIDKATINLYGSFLTTGKGHGTDKAIVAGLLGLDVDDDNIPISFDIAKDKGIDITFGVASLSENAHPNSAQIILKDKEGVSLELVASSIGGGRIMVNEIDGLTANFSGDYPTLIVHNDDQPGHVAEVTSMLQHKMVNIATMQLYRSGRGGNAVMIIECDSEIPECSVKWLEHLEGVNKVTYFNPND